MPSMSGERGGAVVGRRRVLQLFGGAGASVLLGSMLGACGRNEPDSEPEGTGSPQPDAGEISGTVAIAIPMATSADEAFYRDQFEQFTADTGVEVDFLPFPDPQYAESIQGLFRGGDEPDVYRMVKPPAQMYPSWSQGWIQPLDGYEVVTSLLADEYGESALDPARSGLHINGELYGVPGLRNTSWAALRPLMVNMELLNAHGISEPPQTWSELRDAAAKVATDSGGDAYGLALVGGNNLLQSNNVFPLVTTAGPVRLLTNQVPIDYQTGQAGASHPSVVDSVALTRGFVEDGSVVPGWQNMDPQGFWQAWAAGQIAMAPISPWWSEEIAKINPQASMEFVAVPVPDSGQRGFQSTEFAWAPTWGLTKQSSNPEAAASLIAFLGSLEVQRQYYGAARIPSALANGYADELTDIAAGILDLEPKISKPGPSPTARSVDARGVIQAIQQAMPAPTFDEIIFSAVDQGADYEDLAGGFDAALNDVIAAEIDKAIQAGANLDENVFTFSDWDPTMDYVTDAGA